ncbi:MAG TPA: hypothetical protein VNL77_23175 [Roseiflexaceae bacterium]|nr:hypothetical protein [Roseiflexaceae bacterium]
MPTVRKLTPEEVKTIKNRGKGQRKIVEEQYDEYLRNYVPGDYGEADLSPEENRLTVRNRLRAAAARRGLGLEFRRTKGRVLRFRVLDSEEAAALARARAARASTTSPSRARSERQRST